MPTTFVTATHTGLVRRGNEDAALADPPLFAVADGMGGAQAGEVAAGMVVAALQEHRPRTAAELAALVEASNRSIFERAAGNASRSGMGTTLTAALIGDGRVDFVHVGDSRAYRLRDGRLEQLSDDHSLVGEMVRRGELSEAGALSHPQRSIITRALGVDDTVEVDSFSVELAPGDRFLLCSDGLYSMVPAERIEAILGGGADLATIAAALIEAANAGGGEDNITVVVFSPDGSVPAGSAVDTSIVPAGDEAESAAGERPEKERGRWWRSWRVLAVSIAALIVLLLAGTWYLSQQFYYVGESDGKLAIFQGVPLEIGPLSLSSLYRQSDVTLGSLEPFEQERVRRQELSSLKTAEAMLENYAGRQPAQPDPDRGSGSGRTTGTRTSSTTVEF